MTMTGDFDPLTEAEVAALTISWWGDTVAERLDEQTSPPPTAPEDR